MIDGHAEPGRQGRGEEEGDEEGPQEPGTSHPAWEPVRVSFLATISAATLWERASCCSGPFILRRSAAEHQVPRKWYEPRHQTQDLIKETGHTLHLERLSLKASSMDGKSVAAPTKNTAVSGGVQTWLPWGWVSRLAPSCHMFNLHTGIMSWSCGCNLFHDRSKVRGRKCVLHQLGPRSKAPQAPRPRAPLWGLPRGLRPGARAPGPHAGRAEVCCGGASARSRRRGDPGVRGNWNAGFLDYILPLTPGGFRRFPETNFKSSFRGAWWGAGAADGPLRRARDPAARSERAHGDGTPAFREQGNKRTATSWPVVYQKSIRGDLEVCFLPWVD